MRSRTTLLSLIGALSLHAQTIQWQDTINFSNDPGFRLALDGQDHAYALGKEGLLARYTISTGQRDWVVQLDTLRGPADMVWHPSGQVLIAGEENLNLSNTNDVLVTAIDTNGNELWQFEWNDSLNLRDAVSDMALDPAGNILLSVTSEMQPIYSGNQTTIKLSPTGALLWRRTYGFAFPHEEKSTGIATDAAGAVYQCGVARIGASQDDQWCVVKYDANGVRLWTRLDGTPPSLDQASFILPAPGGGCYVGGVTTNAIDNDLTLRRYNGNGAPQWTRSLNAQQESFLYDMALDAQGNVVLVGQSLFSPQGDGYLLAKVSPTNQLLWSLVRPGVGTERRASSLDIATDGTILVAGSVPPTGPLSEGFVDAYADDGSILWTHLNPGIDPVYSQNNGDVRHDGSGGVLVTGQFDGASGEIATYRLCTAPTGACLLPQGSTGGVLAQGLATGDADGDGLTDLFAAGTFAPFVAIHQGTGTGFTAADSVALPFTARSLRSADLDGDGDLDLMAGRATGNDVVALYNSNGSFTVGGPITLAAPVGKVDVAQLDGTNGPDIVVSHAVAGLVTVLLHTGGTGYAQGTFSTIANVGDILLADADADGQQDLLVAATGNDSLYVHRGNGNGTFQGPDGRFTGILIGPRIATGDIDRDGVTDLAVLTGGTGISVFRGLGGGAYAPVSYTGLGINNVDGLLVSPFPPDSTVRFVVSRPGQVFLAVYSACTGQLELSPVINGTGTLFTAAADITDDQGVDLVAYASTGSILWRQHCDTSAVITTLVPEPIGTEAPGVLTVHPNPATEAIQLTWPGEARTGEVVVFDAHGAQVLGPVMLAKGGRSDLGALAPGLHLVRVRTATGTFTARVVVQGR